MLKKIKNKINSDKGAMGTVEVVILIALAIFAALALFTFILEPTRDGAEVIGGGIEDAGNDAIKAMTGDYE